MIYNNKLFYLDLILKEKLDLLIHRLDYEIDSFASRRNPKVKEYLPRNLTQEEIKEDETLGLVSVYKIRN